eukprot:2254282-Pyramimonas_sp.AAC.1
MLRGQCGTWEHKLCALGWKTAFAAAAAAASGGTAGGLLQCVPAESGLAEVECVDSLLRNGRVRILHSHGLTPL